MFVRDNTVFGAVYLTPGLVKIQGLGIYLCDSAPCSVRSDAPVTSADDTLAQSEQVCSAFSVTITAMSETFRLLLFFKGDNSAESPLIVNDNSEVCRQVR
jgi:hypothetical protein